MEESMRNKTLSSKSRNIGAGLSSFIDSAIPKLTILPPSLKLSLTVRFAKNRLHMIRGSEQRTTTTSTKKKKKKQRSWVKPINRLARRISSMIYNSLGGIKKWSSSSSSHWDDDDDDDDDDVVVEEIGERENDDESLEYLMYKLSLALDGTTSSRYIPLMELLKQMRGVGGRLVRERKMGRRFYMFSSRRRRRRRNRARTIVGKVKKITDKETVEEDDEWGNGEELCNRRILMGWRCRPIMDDDDDHDHDGVFLSHY